MKNQILILDFGSQYTQLIARRVREIGIYCEIYPYTASDDKIKTFDPSGIILSGGPESVTQNYAPKAPEIVFNLNIPVLGICYGMQTMAAQLGGSVINSEKREFGYAKVRAHNHSALLAGIEDHITEEGYGILEVWMSHGDKVEVLPDNFTVIASSENAPISGIADEKRKFYALQFHPEVTHTKQGITILKRFVTTICKCEVNWSIENIIQETITTIKNKVGTEGVLLALSGGVDSSVVASLLQQAIGNKLVCVFVDTGLLRLQESEQVNAIFKKNLGINLITINAKERFLQALKEITDPEQKRKIIGRTFIEIFEEQANKIDNIQWLAQGTIYPDVIESAGDGQQAKVIKSHHNVGGLPETLQLKLLEPLRYLFKDEVRKIGLELGLPYDLVYRHPFPGPGLAVRILGEIKEEYIEILQKADAIFIEALHKANLYHKTSQAFVVFLPVKSVAVQGDNRSYSYVLALRSVETIDFMTANWSHLPYNFLEEVSRRIINEIPEVSRVVYDISAKPPATIEWE